MSVNTVLTTKTKMDNSFIEKTRPILKCLCSSSKIINEAIVKIKVLRKTNTRKEGVGIFTIPRFQTWRLKKALGTFLQSAGS